jgi:hypothetical protein
MPVIHVPVVQSELGGDVMSVMLGSKGYRTREVFGEGGLSVSRQGWGDKRWTEDKMTGGQPWHQMRLACIKSVRFLYGWSVKTKLKGYSAEMLGAICVGLCGGEISGTGVVVRTMRFARSDFNQRVCTDCTLRVCATQLYSAFQ